MNILDEDINALERERLRVAKLRFRQVGYELGRQGMKDRNEVIPLLHRLRRPTLFTRDHGFYTSDLCHAGYCLVFLDVEFDEPAIFIRRLLRHPAFRTQASRMGKVIRVRHGGLSYWQVGVQREHKLDW